eukprot:13249128-Alexandrium_andersonii.AAC.1
MHLPAKLQAALDPLPLLGDASGQPGRHPPSDPKVGQGPRVDPIKGALVVPGARHVGPAF